MPLGKRQGRFRVPWDRPVDSRWCVPRTPVGPFPVVERDLPPFDLSRNVTATRIVGVRRSCTMQDHRRLRVWRKAHDLAIEVRRATRRFPRRDHGSLRSQIARAADSIVLNIVEGCGARSRKVFARYLDQCTQSTSELESGLELAKDDGFLKSHVWEDLTGKTVVVRRMACGLRAKVLEVDRREAAQKKRATGKRANRQRTNMDPPSPASEPSVEP